MVTIHVTLFRIAITLGLAVVAVACSSFNSNCNRSGCDALTTRAPGGVTGIGGIVATESDVVANGCQECSFGRDRLEFWKIDVPTTPESDVAASSGTPATQSADASTSYRVALDPGTYVVCADGHGDTHCVEATVLSGQVTTVNLKQRYGPVGYWVVDPATGRFVEDFGIARP